MKAVIFTILLLACADEPTGSTPSDDQTGNPLTTQDKITIASWNIQVLGQSKLGDSAKMDVIVKTLKRYDITAIQEIRNADQIVAPTLIQLMNADGSKYKYVISDRLGYSTAKEQYLIVYDDDLIDQIPNTEGYGFEPNDEYSREPFYTMFNAGNFDFYLMTIHTSPSNVDLSIPALDDTYEHLQSNTQNEHDIILLGDFNAKAPGTSAGSYATMTDLATVPNIFFAFYEVTNTKGTKAYDNIIFQSNYTTEYTNESGVYDFWTPEGLTQDEGSAISDHRSVWARFSTSGVDDD